MIISGGENVYTKEVEDVISQVPSIIDVAVFGIPDDKWGEVVCAGIVLRAESCLSAEDITRHCREFLANFKVPKKVFFLDSLPRNVSGKVLKRNLREMIVNS